MNFLIIAIETYTQLVNIQIIHNQKATVCDA